MGADPADLLKAHVRQIAQKYTDRFRRSRRLYVEERAAALVNDREVEYEIKESIASYFGIGYSEVAFTGSAQLGFSAHKNRAFLPAVSDLDVACVSARLFQKGWADVISSTRAFNDETKFSGLTAPEIQRFKEGILKRGMIRVELMPRSALSLSWKTFESRLSRDHSRIFGSVSVAIYLSEYAFCWKQDSAISTILREGT